VVKQTKPSQPPDGFEPSTWAAKTAIPQQPVTVYRPLRFTSHLNHTPAKRKHQIARRTVQRQRLTAPKTQPQKHKNSDLSQGSANLYLSEETQLMLGFERINRIPIPRSWAQSPSSRGRVMFVVVVIQ